MKTLVAIDPGTSESAVVILSYEKKKVVSIIEHKKISNDEILPLLKDSPDDLLVIEMIASYGMPVGKEVFETCLWIGRFIESFIFNRSNKAYFLVYRKDVKLNLCLKTAGVKDSNIRQALIDRFGEQGNKKDPGFLYGIKGDEWSALAVGVTFVDKI